MSATNIQRLAEEAERRKGEIEEWIQARMGKVDPSLYESFDLRHAGFKAAVVDPNLFPAGFNNLSGYCRELASSHMKEYLSRRFPEKNKILLVGEPYTRNKFYLENLLTLKTIFEHAGFECRAASFSEEIKHGREVFMTAKNRPLEVFSPERKGELLAAGDFVPDIVVLNTSLKKEVPEKLAGISQPIIPNPLLGLHHRKKSNHFRHAKRLMEEFAEFMGADPWLLSAYYEVEEDVDFKNRKGLDRIAKKVDAMLAEIRKKYEEHSVEHRPFVYVKNNSGALGRSMVRVHSGEEILGMNSQARRNMDVGVEGVKVRSVLIQEGIPTIDRYDGVPAEEVMMVTGGAGIGGFFRYHRKKDEEGNLNTPGMEFQPDILCVRAFSIGDYPSKANVSRQAIKLFKLMASIHAIAVGHEIRELENE